MRTTDVIMREFDACPAHRGSRGKRQSGGGTDADLVSGHVDNLWPFSTINAGVLVLNGAKSGALGDVITFTTPEGRECWAMSRESCCSCIFCTHILRFQSVEKYMSKCCLFVDSAWNGSWGENHPDRGDSLQAGVATAAGGERHHCRLHRRI